MTVDEVAELVEEERKRKLLEFQERTCKLKSRLSNRNPSIHQPSSPAINQINLISEKHQASRYRLFGRKAVYDLHASSTKTTTTTTTTQKSHSITRKPSDPILIPSAKSKNYDEYRSKSLQGFAAVVGIHFSPDFANSWPRVKDLVDDIEREKSYPSLSRSPENEIVHVHQQRTPPPQRKLFPDSPSFTSSIPYSPTTVSSSFVQPRLLNSPGDSGIFEFDDDLNYFSKEKVISSRKTEESPCNLSSTAVIADITCDEMSLKHPLNEESIAVLADSTCDEEMTLKHPLNEESIAVIADSTCDEEMTLKHPLNEEPISVSSSQNEQDQQNNVFSESAGNIHEHIELNVSSTTAVTFENTEKELDKLENTTNMDSIENTDSPINTNAGDRLSESEISLEGRISNVIEISNISTTTETTITRKVVKEVESNISSITIESNETQENNVSNRVCTGTTSVETEQRNNCDSDIVQENLKILETASDLIYGSERESEKESTHSGISSNRLSSNVTETTTTLEKILETTRKEVVHELTNVDISTEASEIESELNQENQELKNLNPAKAETTSDSTYQTTTTIIDTNNEVREIQSDTEENETGNQEINVLDHDAIDYTSIVRDNCNSDIVQEDVNPPTNSEAISDSSRHNLVDAEIVNEEKSSKISSNRIISITTVITENAITDTAANEESKANVDHSMMIERNEIKSENVDEADRSVEIDNAVGNNGAENQEIIVSNVEVTNNTPIETDRTNNCDSDKEHEKINSTTTEMTSELGRSDLVEEEKIIENDKNIPNETNISNEEEKIKVAEIKEDQNFGLEETNSDDSIISKNDLENIDEESNYSKEYSETIEEIISFHGPSKSDQSNIIKEEIIEILEYDTEQYSEDDDSVRQVLFSFSDYNAQHSSVYLTGDFDNWNNSIEMTYQLPQRCWMKEMMLDVSREWEFRFVVDGVGTYCEQLKTRIDESGNVNNVLLALDGDDEFSSDLSFGSSNSNLQNNSHSRHDVIQDEISLTDLINEENRYNCQRTYSPIPIIQEDISLVDLVGEEIRYQGFKSLRKRNSDTVLKRLSGDKSFKSSSLRKRVSMNDLGRNDADEVVEEADWKCWSDSIKELIERRTDVVEQLGSTDIAVDEVRLCSSNNSILDPTEGIPEISAITIDEEVVKVTERGLVDEPHLLEPSESDLVEVGIESDDGIPTREITDLTENKSILEKSDGSIESQEQLSITEEVADNIDKEILEESGPLDSSGSDLVVVGIKVDDEIQTQEATDIPENISLSYASEETAEAQKRAPITIYENVTGYIEKELVGEPVESSKSDLVKVGTEADDEIPTREVTRIPENNSVSGLSARNTETAIPINEDVAGSIDKETVNDPHPSKSDSTEEGINKSGGIPNSIPLEIPAQETIDSIPPPLTEEFIPSPIEPQKELSLKPSRLAPENKTSIIVTTPLLSSEAVSYNNLSQTSQPASNNTLTQTSRIESTINTNSSSSHTINKGKHLNSIDIEAEENQQYNSVNRQHVNNLTDEVFSEESGHIVDTRKQEFENCAQQYVTDLTDEAFSEEESKDLSSADTDTIVNNTSADNLEEVNNILPGNLVQRRIEIGGYCMHIHASHEDVVVLLRDLFTLFAYLSLLSNMLGQILGRYEC